MSIATARRTKILAVDDDLFYRQLLAAELAAWGFDATIVETGEEAWRLLEDGWAPSIVLIDWIMPGVDGLELCRRIRSTPRTTSTYVILMTCKTGAQNIATGCEAGADDYLAKPFDLEALFTRLMIAQLRTRRSMVPLNGDPQPHTLDAAPSA